MTNQEKKEYLQKYRAAVTEANRLDDEIKKWRSTAERTTTVIRMVPAGGGGGGGRRVEPVDTDTLPTDKLAAIAAVEETKFGIKVSTYDKVRALELLGKHLGLFDGRGGQAQQENNLLATIKQSGEGLSGIELPEVQPTATADADVVE